MTAPPPPGFADVSNEEISDGPVELAWEYAYDDGAEGPRMLFRANRYPADHPAVTAIINRGL